MPRPPGHRNATAEAARFMQDVMQESMQRTAHEMSNDATADELTS